MLKSKSLTKFLNRTERSVKRLDATDILIILFSGVALGTVLTAMSKKFMKTIAPFMAIFGAISSAFIIVKLFFNKDDDIPYVRIRR